MKVRVALLFGGRSPESDISVITAMQVVAQLAESDYTVEPVCMYEGGFYMYGVDRLEAFTPFVAEKHVNTFLLGGAFYSLKKNKIKREFKPDVALICCHGGEGENGVLQGLLEFNGIPYCSSGVLGSAVGMDKAVSKSIFENMLMNVIQHTVVLRREFESDAERTLAQIESVLDYPMIVKPASQGSSIGIKVADDREGLIFALETACEFDDKILVEEKLVDFAEVNCAAFARGREIVVSETERPLGAGDILTFEDKYLENGKMSGGGHILPADIGHLNAIVRANTERVYRELELQGIVRVDFLVDKSRNKVYINEINTVPGSLAFYLFEPLGISFAELLDAQICNALLRAAESGRKKVFKSRVLECYGKGVKNAKYGKLHG